MVDAFVVPQKTVVTSKGDGQPTDIGAASSRVFLLILNITDIVEQESIGLSVYGSADGTNWGQNPLISFPQKFYRGQYPSLLDISDQPLIKFLRAHWEVNRWGRGESTPRFEFDLSVKEVASEVMREIAAAAGC